ncbi:hypothetical protein LJR153_000577 [Paenibacillus sp. LjRoot153]|uniref:hypothetical protein n=1 Tax=Paenibacillus sp. LjRoot153 TaxID=3342270 RepID=UPI003ECE70FC
MSKKNNINDQGCCGGPAPTETNACCVEDANAKANGQDGCGCASDSAITKTAPSSCC